MHATSVVGGGYCDRVMPTPTCQHRCRCEGILGRVVQTVDSVGGAIGPRRLPASSTQQDEDEDGNSVGGRGGSRCSLWRARVTTSGCRGQHDGWPRSSDLGLAGDRNEGSNAGGNQR
ncbi:hypothetical protein ACLOJK_007137 [Asimina triloba]